MMRQLVVNVYIYIYLLDPKVIHEHRRQTLTHTRTHKHTRHDTTHTTDGMETSGEIMGFSYANRAGLMMKLFCRKQGFFRFWEIQLELVLCDGMVIKMTCNSINLIHLLTKSNYDASIRSDVMEWTPTTIISVERCMREWKIYLKERKQSIDICRHVRGLVRGGHKKNPHIQNPCTHFKNQFKKRRTKRMINIGNTGCTTGDIETISTKSVLHWAKSFGVVYWVTDRTDGNPIDASVCDWRWC